MNKKDILITFFLILFVICIFETNDIAAWQTLTLDVTGRVGEYNSVAIDSSGYVHISYFDRTNETIKYISEISPFADRDTDGDDIYDLIDILPKIYSNDFSDVDLIPPGTTFGNIVDRGDQILTITNKRHPYGVRISADHAGGAAPTEVSLCGGSTILSLSPGDIVDTTCGSASIKVIRGVVEIVFVSADGTLATTVLYAGNSIIFDPSTFTLTGPSTNSDVISFIVEGPELLLYSGDIIEVTPTRDGDYVPEEQDNCPDTYNPDQADLDGDGIGDVCDYIERYALIDFYNSTDGDNWKNNSGWKGPPLYTDGFAMPGTECTWHGVACTGGEVIGLSLASNNLNGPIPASLGQLTNLTHLQLQGNQLTGPIPAEIGNLFSLRVLDVQKNHLSGGIPDSFGNLTNLNIIKLLGNMFTGEIPSSLGNLVNLQDNKSDIRYNALSTSDDTLRGFLNQKQIFGDWEGTQTIASTDLVAHYTRGDTLNPRLVKDPLYPGHRRI